MNKTLKNILIAVAVGVGVGIIFGVFMPSTNATAAVGAAIGITFALLQTRKA